METQPTTTTTTPTGTAFSTTTVVTPMATSASTGIHGPTSMGTSSVTTSQTLPPGVSTTGMSTIPTAVNPWSGVFSTLSRGSLPANNQLNDTLLLTRSAFDDASKTVPLSAKGQTLVRDTEAIIDSMSRLIREKNQDEKIQKFFAHSQQLTASTARTALPEGTMTSVRTDAKDALNQLRQVLTFLIRSSELRGIMSELVKLGQSILKSTGDRLATPTVAQPKAEVIVQERTLTPTATSTFKEVAVSIRGDVQQGYTTYGSQATTNEMARKLRDLAVALGRNPGYKAAIQRFMSIAQSMKQGGSRVQTANAQNIEYSFDRMWDDGILIVEEFCGKEGPRMFSNEFTSLYQATRSDPIALQYFNDLRAFLFETVQNPEVLQDDARLNVARDLIERGRIIMQSERYKSHFRALLKASKKMLKYMKHDPVMQELAANIRKLVNDSTLDSQGNPDLFVLNDSLQQLRLLAIPVLTRELSNLQLPKMQSSDAKMDMMFENVILHTEDILPHILDMELKSHVKMNPYQVGSGKKVTMIKLKIHQLRPYFENVHFAYKRKTFPRLSDEGIVSVDFRKGEGLNLDIKWLMESMPGQSPEIHLYKVKCRCASLKLNFSQARHKFLDNFATKLFGATIRRQVALSIVKKLTQALEPINTQINKMLKVNYKSTLGNRANQAFKLGLQKAKEKRQSTKGKKQKTISTQSLGPVSTVPTVLETVRTTVIPAPVVTTTTIKSSSSSSAPIQTMTAM